MKKETFDNYNLVLMYAFNYEYNFIERAFPRENNPTDHLLKKFNQYCDESDDNTLGFMKFYASLSDRFKRMLIDYIINESEEMFIGSQWEKYSTQPEKDIEYVKEYKPENDENKRKPIREFGFEGL